MAKHVNHKFGTLTEHLAWIRDNGKHDTDSFGLGSLGKALDLAGSGWSEGVASIDKRAARITAAITRRMTPCEPYFDVAGLEIDMAAYTEGRPEAWLDLAEAPVESPNGRVVRVLFDYVLSGCVENKDLTERGVYVAALVAALETSGRSVEVIARLSSSTANGLRNGSDPGSTFTVETVVKAAGEPVNLASLAFTLTHPAMLRKLGFSLIEDMGNGVYGLGFESNMGYPYRQAAPAGCDVLVPSVIGDLDEEWIVETLRAQGVELTEA
jgi:hypothetical protein